LTAHVHDPEILEHALTRAPQSACDSLIALTIERGASDNVTIIAARYAPHGSTIVLPDQALPTQREEKR
jgi:protein phosphatase